MKLPEENIFPRKIIIYIYTNIETNGVKYLMKIALDLDNTITAYPKYFSLFSKAMKKVGCQIYILTNREPNTKDEIKNELNKLKITYDFIKITANKAQYILEQKINVFIEDTDEYFVNLPEEVLVLKIREAGNFNFEQKKWIT